MFRSNMGMIDDDPFSAETCCKQKCIMYIMKLSAAIKCVFPIFLPKMCLLLFLVLFFFLYSYLFFYIHTRFIGAHLLVYQQSVVYTITLLVSVAPMHSVW